MVGIPKTDMRNLHVVFLFFAGIMFAISLMTLFGYHIYLLANNRSTLGLFIHSLLLTSCGYIYNIFTVVIFTFIFTVVIFVALSYCCYILFILVPVLAFHQVSCHYDAVLSHPFVNI